MARLRWVSCLVWVAVWIGVAPSWAAEPLVEAPVAEALCGLSDAEAPESWEESPQEFHDRRRRAVHGLYWTVLSLEDEAVSYDRVAGVLEISGFRRHQTMIPGVELELRNECILRFVVAEDEAHDLAARIAVGTVDVKVRFLLASHDDYERPFCDAMEEQKTLEIVLLDARLVELDEEGAERILSTYQTGMGHRLSLLSLAGGTGRLPEVQVSHFQWRPRGGAWADDPSEEEMEDLAGLQGVLQANLERATYPCYVRALSRNSSLQGAIVIEVALEAEGPGAARVLMDTLNHEPLQECLGEQLGDLGADLSPAADGMDGFKATILLRRR